MPLEEADYIPQLVDTNPPGTDPVAQGDDHARVTKRAILGSFVGLPNGPVINAPESPNEPDDTLAGNTNIMLWTPKAIKDFIIKNWGAWALSTTTTNAYCRSHNDGSGGAQLFNPAGPFRLPLNVHALQGGGTYDTANARWTPGVAGIYRVGGQWNADPDSNDQNGTLRLEIRVNDAPVAVSTVYYGFDGKSLGLNVFDDAVSITNASDYIELWTNHEKSVNGFFTDKSQTFMAASRVGDLI